MKNLTIIFSLLSVLINFSKSFAQTGLQWEPTTATSTETITRNGNVGIGTSPTTLLNLYMGDFLVQDKAMNFNNGGMGYAPAPVLFAGGKMAGMTCMGCPTNYAGQVGVNTNQPTATLNVKSGTFLVNSASNEYVLFANPSGNLSSAGLYPGGKVGIGTMNPTTKLEIGAKGLSGTNKNVMLKLSNIYNASGSNSPTIQFNNGNPATVWWNMSAVVAGNSKFSISYKEGNTEKEFFRITNTGLIYCEQMKVKLHQDWPDYVFASSNKLIPLNELQKFTELNGHLPDLPSACEVEEDGVDVAAMNVALLKKVEELTLYIFDLNKRIAELEAK